MPDAPSSLPPPGMGVDLDPLDVEQVAGYGPLPAAIWESPLYAFRVFGRQKPLREELAEAKKALSDAESTLSLLLCALVEEASSALRDDVACARVMAEQGEPVTRLIDRRARLVEPSAALDADRASFEQELGKLEKQHAKLRAEVDRLKTEAAKAYGESRQGGSSAAFDSARQKLSAAEEKEQAAHAAITETRRKKKAVEQGKGAELSTLEAGLAQAREAARPALLPLAPTFLAARPKVAYDGWDELESTHQSAERLRSRVTLLEAALTSFSRVHVRNGVAVIAGTIALFILMVLTGVIRMQPPELPPGQS